MDVTSFVSIAGGISLIAGCVLAYLKYFRGEKKTNLSNLLEPKIQSTKPRIIIVDDNREHLQALRLFLNGNYDVRDFEFPHDAINKVMAWHEDDKKLDLAIIDYGMIRLNGIQVVKIIRILYPKTRIVFFSGGAIALERDEKALVDEVWQKPMGMKAIKEAIEKILRN